MSTIEEFAAARGRLRELVGALGVRSEAAGDGSYQLTGFAAPVQVRLRDVGGPVVAVCAVAARHVTDSLQLLIALRDFCVQVPFGRVRLHGGEVALAAEIGAVTAVAPDRLRQACHELAAAAAQLGERLGRLEAAPQITLP